MIKINRQPSHEELRTFGFGLLIFTLVVATIAGGRGSDEDVILRILGGGGTLSILYFLVVPLRRFIYLGWMYAAFPIGWLVSHVILAIVFFGIVTPLGLILRLMRKDALGRTIDRQRGSYWHPRTRSVGLDRYFRQF